MSWLDNLDEEFSNNSELSHIEFLNKYEDIVPGPNRDAKRRKVKRKLEELRQLSENGGNVKSKPEKYMKIFLSLQ